jgi:Transposase DDE domain
MTKALPWAHGHQIKGISAYVEAILQRQSGKQAELARGIGNQEAAVKRLSRLIHNERLDPAKLANALLVIALAQLPGKGKVGLTLDWTIEDDQHLLVISLGVGRRAIPIFWRAYDARVLKGRMKRYEAAILKRVFVAVRNKIGRRGIRVTMDRGFADVSLCDVFEAFGVEHLTRAKASTKVLLKGQWRQLQSLSFTTNSRRRNLGKVSYCESSPHQVYASLSRVKNEKEEWEVWYLISNRKLSASQMADEYARRFGCEEGFRDAKWLLGFAQARIQDIKAWSRFFALFAFAMLILTTLATHLLLKDPIQARSLLRRVASRRKGRCELSALNAMLQLLQQLPSLLQFLRFNTKFDLEAQLQYVS